MSSETAHIILEARGITKSFPGVVALDTVDCAIYRGQLNAVVGENGAGKSTLMNILSGVYEPDGGSLIYDGKEVVFADTRQAQAMGITIIHQELNLIPHMSIAENIFLGREFRNRLGLIDYARLHREAGALLERLDLHLDPSAPIAALRVGQQQVVEIAKALSLQARVIIMDEPTSALSEHEVEILFEVIDGLKRDGVTIVYITHKLDELFRIGDRLTVLRDGKLVGTSLLSEVEHDDVVRMMIGRDLGKTGPKRAVTGDEQVLVVENLTLSHPDRPGDYLVAGVSFAVRRGEVLGLFGLMGAGRTELLEAVFGLHSKVTGTVTVEGEVVAVRSPRDAIRAGIALAPEDRKRDGLVMSMSVAANLSLSSLRSVERYWLLQGRREAELVEELSASLRIKISSRHQLVASLSGGNQQKVVLAKWLATSPKVFLLDEPTRGIDVNAKKEIYALIEALTAESMAVVLASSELPELLAVCDRIFVMREGRKTAEFPRGAATEERLLKAALPGPLE